MGSPEAWGAAKHVLPATPENDLCCRHSARPTLEAHVQFPSDVLANFATSGGRRELLAALKTALTSRTAAPIGRKRACRLRAVAVCAERIVKYDTIWEGRGKMHNVLCEGAGFRPSKSAPKPKLPCEEQRNLARNLGCRLDGFAIWPFRRGAVGGYGRRTTCLEKFERFLAPGGLWKAQNPCIFTWYYELHALQSRIHAFLRVIRAPRALRSRIDACFHGGSWACTAQRSKIRQIY